MDCVVTSSSSFAYVPMFQSAKTMIRVTRMSYKIRAVVKPIQKPARPMSKLKPKMMARGIPRM